MKSKATILKVKILKVGIYMNKLLFSSITLSFFLCLIQTSLFAHIPFFLITADLMLVYTTYLAIHNGSRISMFMSFGSGLFLDFMSTSPLGLSSFILVFISFFLGKLHGKYDLNHFVVPFVLAILAMLTKLGLLVLLHFLFGSTIRIYNMYEARFWIEVILNISFAPLLFFALNRFPTFFKSMSEI